MKKEVIFAAAITASLALFGCTAALPNTAKAGDASIGYPDG